MTAMPVVPPCRVPLCTVCLVVLALAACDGSQGGSTAVGGARSRPAMETLIVLPLGDVAGATDGRRGAGIANPFGDSPQARQQGQDLFVRMNCAGCHGYGATGGMGPDLGDTYWRYGGTPAAIFKSIYEGRPQGMPAWNPALPPDEIWKLVAYIDSLGGSYNAGQYAASVQGDRVGDRVAPDVKPTLTGSAAASGPTADGQGDGGVSTEARPDAGGE